MHVGHLGTTDPHIHPAHHIAQYALSIVVEFLLNSCRSPIAARRQWRRQHIGQRRALSLGELPLDCGNVDGVIVHGMQRSRCRRWHPGGIGAGLRMANLSGHHLRHQIRHGPHTLADLRPSRQTALQPDVDILPLIGVEPDRVLDLALAQHGAGRHRGMNLIASTIEKPRVDEHHALARRANALGQIDTGAPLFIHDAHL